MEESSPEYSVVVLHFTLVSSDRDPVTPQVDGKREEGGVERGSEGVARATGVDRAASGHQTPPSAIRTAPVCSVIKINDQKLTAGLLFSL